MENEMIERAARHLCRTHQAVDFRQAREYVRTVMEAIREPTAAMLAAPYHEGDACDAQYEDDDAFARAWSAMIDAGLEKPALPHVVS